MEKILFIFLLSLVGNITAQEGFVFSGKIVGDNGNCMRCYWTCSSASVAKNPYEKGNYK